MTTNLNLSFAPRIATLATAISLALLAACSDQNANKPVSKNGRTPAVTSTAAPSLAENKPTPQENKEADIGQKMKAYIECFNVADRSGHNLIARYASWVDMKAGPTGKERHIYGLYKIHENVINLCQKKMTAVLDLQPAMDPLDTTARAYLGALLSLAERAEEATKYYDRQDYQDDDFTKGKQMHAPLVQAMENFKTASKAFSDALEVENDKLQEQELEQVEKTEGRKLRYWRMLTMAEAKQLIGIIAEENFDMNKATAKLADFEKAADELGVYAKANKDELPVAWSSMDSAIEDFRIAAKERIRRVRDKKPYSQGELIQLQAGSGWMVDGSADKLIRKYNDLVSRSNSIR